MRKFLISSLGVGFGYYLLLFYILNHSSNLMLSDALHVLILYVVPPVLLICVAASLGLLTRERRTMTRVAGVFIGSFIASFVALQLAGAIFCIFGSECF